jgi:hypothetical protein
MCCPGLIYRQNVEEEKKGTKETRDATIQTGALGHVLQPKEIKVDPLII